MSKLISDYDMSLNEYQKLATKTASYPDVGCNIIYPALGLAGEAGEVAEKVKKLWRNRNITSGKELETILANELIKELGDTLWYIAALANELNVPLADIARSNITKLQDRLERGVIKSAGDNR